MTVEDIMEYWTELETDFMTQYGVLDPLALTWRKLLVLVRGLAPTSHFINVIRESTPEYRREIMRKALHGHEEDFSTEKPTVNRVSADEFLKGI